MTRVAWWAVIAGLAILVILSQLDRASRHNPAIAVAVPGPFKSFAQQPTALAALVSGDPEVALTEARRLVRRRPLPAEHTYILALAELGAGNSVGYARAFELATTRGWRTVPVQVAAAEAAIGRGDAKAGALRVAALWMVDGSNPAVPTLTRSLLALSAGPEAFGETMAGMRMTPASLVSRIGGMATRQQAARVVDAATQSGMAFTAADLARIQQLPEANIPATTVTETGSPAS